MEFVTRQARAERCDELFVAPRNRTAAVFDEERVRKMGTTFHQCILTFALYCTGSSVLQ